MAKPGRKIMVIGHKNPDTDSISAAIAYAYLKNVTLNTDEYEARRAGKINEETKYVLDRFHVAAPSYISDVGTQVSDIDIRFTQGIDQNMSLKKAWEIMKRDDVVTLPVTDENQYLQGLIITGDIAMSYMDVYDKGIISEACTPYRNIVETLDGQMLVGDESKCFDKGNVLVGAGNPEAMEEFIHEHDMIILGNRYESQICALEKKVSCMIVCANYKVASTIKKLAEEKGCAIISTPYDTYTTARLINQSMPVRHFMRKENLITFEEDSYVEEVLEVMSKERHRDFPILDGVGKYIGMISRRNLLQSKKKQVILVDHNEKSQAVDGIDSSEILEIIDHHRLGSLETMSPVFFRNQPLGSSSTIVYLMFKEKHIEVPQEIAGILCSAIISDTLMYRSPTCTQVDQVCAQELAAIAKVDVEELAINMFKAGSSFDSKTVEEIFYQDFKTFTVSGIEFGVGQISSMSEETLLSVKEQLLSYMPTALKERGLDMVYMMMTNILEESTGLLSYGKDAAEVVEKAYQVKEQDGVYKLEGVISRKKQLIPSFLEAMQE
ncbi:putative manganese-dependent inorganic diphosphatase [Eubacterium oxidoreducens]|uniref:inorganic diphosphatase n=1 Tax=Eubacterium oxidoreducens TaxID=1732 RepID=A0A1G6AQT5_EUBOX|nr:putative manganese-dependent inorganic diphosphatase [Eubacterium oxidoreducens]SDB10719.1 manganese-dependent inorganic pyrophosphatase [Eubacterium oxidoreducens]